MHLITKFRLTRYMSVHRLIIIFAIVNTFILLWMIYEYSVYNSWREILQIDDNHLDGMELTSLTRSKDLRVYIVEEHHEVIPYWFDAAKSFGNKKAVLVHIDAHSDMDYPELVDGFPIGHFPRSRDEIETLMQANDEFIQSAIISNLLQSVYIIYPYWTFNTSYAYTSSLGIISINDTQQICMCLDINNSNNNNGDTGDSVDDDDGEGDSDEESCKTRKQDNSLNDALIPNKQCSKTWLYHFAEFNSRTASNILRYSKYWSLKKILNITNALTVSYAFPIPRFLQQIHRRWQQQRQQQQNRINNDTHLPLILDIDEDFFGVHLVMRSLLKTGLTSEFIFSLNNLIPSIFCPLSHIDELDIDQIYRWLLEQVYLTTHYSNYRKRFTIESYALNDILSSINKNLQITDIFCHNYTLALKKFNELFKNTSITYEQFNALTRVGVCLTNSLLTHQYTPEIHLCIGHNTPNASLVEEFIPTSDDLLQLAVQFTQILLSLPYPPNVISVSRSSRDGYTPRWLQYNIETIILNILKRVFDLTDENIVYTKYLAGNKRQGWYRRFTWTSEEE
ncbi:unnamed protein product [Trichobilharzia szidati]|nr:unnamed protein product [Trichobilharzia szidati]